jgi:hypothetical protein
MSCRTCDHLKEDGVYCSSPALRDQRYCYFHLNARARRVQAAHAKLHNEPFRLQMPILDNAHAILSGIQQALDALAGTRISARQAAVYLYGLQMASVSLKSQPEWKGSRPEIEADQPLRALEVRSLRDQYDIPFDTDLEAQPYIAAAEIDATVALPLDARPAQTQQPSLARVPPRPAPHNGTAPANAAREDPGCPIQGPPLALSGVFPSANRTAAVSTENPADAT